ncbi:hypothetical protein [Butyrivibrio sp. MC2021]|uniref:hypothetical protein n=1 Tax=Butyrivibrio sp. MC2021 TaxID=1408306 RepID=UPI00047E6B4A|nr:hypothetical protein [Butyrivibrio sp. MC2021]
MAKFYINPDEVMKSVATLGQCTTDIRSCATQISDVKDSLDSSLAEKVGPALGTLTVRTNQHATNITTLGVTLGAAVRYYIDCESKITGNQQKAGNGPQLIPLSAPETGGTPAQPAAPAPAANPKKANANQDWETLIDLMLLLKAPKLSIVKQLLEDFPELIDLMKSGKLDLLMKLQGDIVGYANIGQYLKTSLFNSSIESLDYIVKNDALISQIADANGMDKAMIQAVLFQEIRFYGIDDPLADAAVELGVKGDSSTGLGQIFAGTAIEAYNHFNPDSKLSADNPEDIAKMWEQLQDPAYNIDMVAKVLSYKAWKNGYSVENMSPEEIQKMFRSYNGSGDLAERYGEVVMNYYKHFKEENGQSL